MEANPDAGRMVPDPARSVVQEGSQAATPRHGAVSRGIRASVLVYGVLLLGAALVLSGCEEGPGASDTTTEPTSTEPTPTEPTPTPAKAKPALPELTATADSGPVSDRAAALRSAGTGDDHGNSRSTATTVAPGSSTAGTLTPGDVDVFVITLSRSGTLSAHTTGDTDTVGLILGERGWYDFDDDSGDGYNFWLSASLNAGTYYVAVFGYDRSVSGNYTLVVRFRENVTPSDDDHGNSRRRATKVAAGSDTSGTLTPRDVDYFAIKIRQAGTLSATTTGDTDTVGVLHDSRRALDSDDDGGSDYNFALEAPVSAGTHYVEVKGYSGATTGDYTLHVSFTPQGSPLPLAPTAPSPADEAHDVELDADLSWTSGGGLSTSYDVYFGADATLGADALRATQETTTYDPGRLAPETVYFWRVDAKNDAGTTAGPVWSFTTISAADRRPQFGTATITDRTYPVDRQIWSFVLPAANGGDPPLSYRLAPEVPGLEFDAARRTLSGTPSRAGGYGMRYTVRDADGDEAELIFTITVTGPARHPSFGTATVGDRTYPVAEQIAPFELPAASGGQPPLSYRLEPAVPGLAFDAVKRTLSGTPSTAGSYGMRYTVRDAGGAEATLTFTITVTVPELSFGTATVGDRSYPVDERITPLQLPAASGGVPPLSYRVEIRAAPHATRVPAVPGLAFDAVNRTLSGTPTKVGRYGIRYMVQDAGGAEAELMFTITVTSAAPVAELSFGTATVSDRTYPVDEQITPLVLPVASGGNPPLTYRLEQAVPGLRFDAARRMLSGMPTSAGTYGMTYTVQDAGGAEAELRFTITVTAPELSFGSATVSDRTYPVGEQITPFVLPAASGGVPPLSYRLAPEVPGLSFDGARRTLSGTPSSTGTYGMRYTVRDADGVQAQLRFTIAVTEAADQKLRFEATVSDQTYIQFIMFEPLVLPEATGGDVRWYKLSPCRYSRANSYYCSAVGLFYDANTRTLSTRRDLDDCRFDPDICRAGMGPGTRSVHGPPYPGVYDMTYTAIGADGDEAELSFQITVIEAEHVVVDPDVHVGSRWDSEGFANFPMSVTGVNVPAILYFNAWEHGQSRGYRPEMFARAGFDTTWTHPPALFIDDRDYGGSPGFHLPALLYRGGTVTVRLVPPPAVCVPPSGYDPSSSRYLSFIDVYMVTFHQAVDRLLSGDGFYSTKLFTASVWTNPEVECPDPLTDHQSGAPEILQGDAHVLSIAEAD